jgi:hypothetical protein
MTTPARKLLGMPTLSTATILTAPRSAMSSAHAVMLAAALAMLGIAVTPVRAQQTAAPQAVSDDTSASTAAKPGRKAKAAAKDASKDNPDEPKVSRTKAPSPNAMVNLINAMVEQGLLSEDKAAALIKQAEDEAYVARQAARDATAKADDASKAATTAAAAASPPGTQRVSYVPEIVKRQLREELKKEVLATAQKDNWASPGTYPEWASRIHLYGDVRTRYEGINYPKGNADGGNFPNFNTINSGSPYDLSKTNPNLFPNYNTNQDRDRFRLRARLGMDADLTNGFTAGLRIGTGENSSPVSQNQTLGGSGGNFSKYALWLDRGWIKYQPWDGLAVSVGRFDNPFFSPIDLVWNKDIGFDGAAVQARYEVVPGVTPFVVAGAFPIFNTDLNFATNQAIKLPSDDRYLFGGQIGTGWKAAPDISVKFGAAYYDFTNIQGRLSDPCIVNNANDVCDSDALRPSFAQNGNTYMSLRNIVATLDNNLGTTSQFQYFGLASAFRDVVLTGQVDFAAFHPVHVVLDGEFVKNVAFNRGALEAIAVNNRAGVAAGSPPGTIGAFAGGDTGWYARMTVGAREIRQLGDWNVHVGYKYLESDAVVDAFTDSDFGLGGPNLKGYTIGGNVGLSSNVWLTARWMSANAIAGPPFAVDVVQVDLNARF